MNKIVKAQAGVAAKSIPVQRYPAINVGEIVSNLTKNGAEVGREAISIGSKIGKGALRILSGPLGILALALSGDMDAQQPHSEMGRLQETRRLTKRAIPVYGKQSGTSTPVMGKKKKTTKARPTITRTPDAESTSVPVGSGAIAGSEDAAQRDTVRVTNGAAVENATPQDTVNVQHKNDKNTEVRLPALGLFKNVFLTQQELDSLKSQYPDDYSDKIERLSRYLASTGKFYRNHYAVLLQWLEQDLPKEPKRKASYDIDELEKINILDDIN